MRIQKILIGILSCFIVNLSLPISEKKLWTIIIYMSADNDLHLFADRNIEQMKRIGSTEFCNILVHLDIRKPNVPKVTKRLHIQKNKALQCGSDLCMDSGSEATLVDAILWAQNEFPCEHLAVVFWNHGSGDLNPTINRTINPAQLFFYNPNTRLIELDRSIGFLDYIDALLQKNSEQRGICFDDSMGTYLNDQKLKAALGRVCAERGKKIDLLLFDACLMAGLGTAWLMKDFADYMVASEEVALGPGYDYSLVLSAFAHNQIEPRRAAHHVVTCYEKIYSRVTQDYTQSAFDLSQVYQLAEHVDKLAEYLIQALKHQRNNSVKNSIRQALACVVFKEPTYRDLGSFYQKLLGVVHNFQLKPALDAHKFITELERHLIQGLELIKNVVIANVTGSKIKGALGIYLYIPSKRIHSSYIHTEFAQHNRWKDFLTEFLTNC